MATYICRADGTAATYDLAIGPASDASKCMTFAVHNAAGDAFLPNDDLELSDQGGVFFETLIPPSAGDSDNQITYKNVAGESPVISGSDNDDEESPSYDRSECIDINGKSYITIDGIEYRLSGGEVSPADGEGIKIHNAAIGIIVQNCEGHNHENESLKLYDTCEANTNNNNWHDDGDSDVSLHDAAIWRSTLDTFADSQYAVENIGTSKAYIDQATMGVSSAYCIGLVADSPYLELTNSTLDLNEDAGLGGGVNFKAASYGIIGKIGNGNTIKNGGRLIRHEGTGTIYVRYNTFELATIFGIENAGTGRAWVENNTFKNCRTYGVKNDSTAIMYLFRNWNTILGANYGNFTNLRGLFSAAGNVSDFDTSYAFLVDGTVNAASILANNYVNDSAFNGIECNDKILTLRNNAVQGSVQENYDGIDNCTVENNISNKADLPEGDGNVNSATFTSYYASIVPGESDYALPIEDAGAHGTGTDPGIASFLAYLNGVSAVFADMDIGAKGLERSVTDINKIGKSIGIGL